MEYEKHKMRFITPTARQIGNSKNEVPNLSDVFVLKEETFGMQLELYLGKKTFVAMDDSVPWFGLQSLCRLEVVGENLQPEIFFEEAVMDDDEILKKDRIVFDKNKILSKGYYNFWIEMKALKPGKQTLTARLYERTGYEEEKIIGQCSIEIEVAQEKMPEKKYFYMDLWQHPSSIANYYQVERFGKQHFEILESYIEKLAEANQKVIDLIVSDYPWAGQECYTVIDNPTSLFEYNIVKINQVNDTFQYDYSALDRYISLCEKYGIEEEINLFGLVGNWMADTFGNPLKDYGDPIRLRYTKEDGTYAFIHHKKDITDYILSLFSHLKELNVWDKTKIIGDLPPTKDFVSDSEKFLIECDPTVSIKYAIRDFHWLEDYEKDYESYSVRSYDLVQMRQEKPALDYSKLTFFTCWEPFNFNQFINSNLMESRLVGYFAYVNGLKGFLRWNYCLWTQDPNEDIRYKRNRWSAGDMFFVYPGRNGKPESSLRFQQLIYSANDYNFFIECEKKIGYEKVAQCIEKVLGKMDEMTYDADQKLLMTHYMDDFEQISKMKRELIALCNSSLS